MAIKSCSPPERSGWWVLVNSAAVFDFGQSACDRWQMNEINPPAEITQMRNFYGRDTIYYGRGLFLAIMHTPWPSATPLKRGINVSNGFAELN